MLRRGFLLLGTAAGLLGGSASAFAQADPLPSWNEGARKKAILDFVSGTTASCGADFAPVDQRIATFDNDGARLRFMGLVHHTDAVREYAYDRQSHIGKLDEAVQRKWTVVNMKTDWNRIYPFERK